MEKVSYMDRIADVLPMGRSMIAVDRTGDAVVLITMLDHTNTAPSVYDVVKRIVEPQRGGVQGGRGREHV
ncbi:hypothetical protein [Paenibacillus kobensis]|uniref:hypothetical protein n=1 Tax=Paenibacillus kobensis TaxID=59841 RepID=UPI000FDB5CC1|nr:hypothetical protein [Paenibacillus kobensis]